MTRYDDYRAADSDPFVLFEGKCVLCWGTGIGNYTSRSDVCDTCNGDGKFRYDCTVCHGMRVVLTDERPPTLLEKAVAVLTASEPPKHKGVIKCPACDGRGHEEKPAERSRSPRAGRTDPRERVQSTVTPVTLPDGWSVHRYERIERRHVDTYVLVVCRSGNGWAWSVAVTRYNVDEYLGKDEVAGWLETNKPGDAMRAAEDALAEMTRATP